MEVGTDRPAHKVLRFGFAQGFLFRRKNYSLASGFAISVELRPTSTNGRGFLNLFIQCFLGAASSIDAKVSMYFKSLTPSSAVYE